MNLSLLIHTFSKYSFLWEGHLKSRKQNWCLDYPDTYWGTDIPCENDQQIYNTNFIKVKYSGVGEWSDRLIRLLHQIPSDYIIYMQEDHYVTKTEPNFLELCEWMQSAGVLRLQISPVVPFYKLFSEENTLFFDVKSKYLVSHQPSIWKKSFLLDCLKPGETPWQNEYKGTLRLQQTSQIRQFIHKKIAIYPCNWYAHKCIKGKVVENG